MTQNNSLYLKEWAPLTDLFNKLPSKTSGIFSQEIKLTCIDVLPEFLLLGTNVGVIFWFDRKLKDLKRLRCENGNFPVTVVKVVSTVDYMVACGNSVGNITIFQIPKSHPDSLPENLKPKPKQVERYTVTDLHKSPITAIEWSKNGMKLFSGDKSGCIVLTEIDFYMHMCKSAEILNESYEVVQLSYNHQRLLISTTFRSIIIGQQIDKWKVCQVGKKDRKVLGRFGGLIFQRGYKPTDVDLYCIRPGLRIWIADVEGNVHKTLLFKDLLCKECPQVPLLNPISKALQQLKPQREPSFGILLPFCDNLLVTYGEDIVYLLHPTEMTILSTVGHLRGILDVAINKDEIFILEEERSLVRISFHPESDNNSSNLSSTSNNVLSLSANPLKDLATNLQATSGLFGNSSFSENHLEGDINIHTDEDMILNAEEAQESPEKNTKRFDEISKQDFEDDILFKKTKRYKRKKQNKMSSSTASLSSNSSEEKDLSYTRPTIMNLSAVGVLPDLRSPESIINDIEYKEKILADVLNLDRVNISSKNEEKGFSDNLGHRSEVQQPIIKQDNEKPKDSDLIPNYKDIAKNAVDTGKAVSKSSVKTIPNEWNLSNVRVTKEIEKKRVKISSSSTANQRKLSTNDSSSSDWEIV